MCDLLRTLHSFKKGYLTLRIPNSLIRDNLELAAGYITDYINESLDVIEDEW